MDPLKKLNAVTSAYQNLPKAPKKAKKKAPKEGSPEEEAMESPEQEMQEQKAMPKGKPINLKK